MMYYIIHGIFMLMFNIISKCHLCNSCAMRWRHSRLIICK